MTQEKKEREHLLALNQVIARQVIEKSRMVAGTSSSTILDVVVWSMMCLMHGQENGRYLHDLGVLLF